MTRIAAAARVVRDKARVTPRTIAGVGASTTSATTAIINIIDSVIMIAIATTTTIAIPIVVVTGRVVKRHRILLLLQIHTQLILLHALCVRVLVRARQSFGRRSLRGLVAEVRRGGLNDQRC